MKMEIIFRQVLLTGLLILILLSGSCQKDEINGPKITKQKLTGHVQKGPFINGTSISMFELDSLLDQTGKIFTTEISNNSGSFEINNINLASSYVEFSASGYYFDEVKGDISIAPLNLFALSDITDISSVNVNILTHLEKRRVEYLITQHKTFSEAKKIAQNEILAIFGFSLSSMKESEKLDISVNNEENGILLAISIILQGNRSVGDLTELLAGISNDIDEDGLLDDNIKTKLRNSTKELVLANIRLNLVNRFQTLGINASIPDFEKYINEFLVFSGQAPNTSMPYVSDLTTSSVRFNGMVNANSLSTTVIFQFGKTSTYTDSIQAIPSPLTGTSTVNVTANKSGLLPGTLYHMRVKAKNSRGTIYSPDMTFTTLGQVPTAVTNAANNIQLNAATINGSVIPNYLSTTVIFEWGTTSSYGSSNVSLQSPINGSSPVNVSTGLTGLLPGTTYHFRVRAENLLGVTNSNDLIFTTLGQSPLAVTDAPIIVQSNSVTINGSINPNHLSTATTFEWGATSSYGNSATPSESPITGATPVNVRTTLTGLVPGTTYHYRLKAENVLGTTTGNDFTFTTTSPVTDIESNSYNTVAIGNQVWMAENLKATKYSNGDIIGTTLADINSETTPKYQWAYDNNESNVALYGRLYSWHAVAEDRNICPAGWHVPSDAEWTTLTDYLGNNGFGYQGNRSDIAKSLAATSGWTFSSTAGNVGNDQSGNNSSGFTALPGGYRFGNGTFYNVGFVNWWSATADNNIILAWWRSISYNGSYVSRATFSKVHGMSVRCIKNN